MEGEEFQDVDGEMEDGGLVGVEFGEEFEMLILEEDVFVVECA